MSSAPGERMMIIGVERGPLNCAISCTSTLPRMIMPVASHRPSPGARAVALVASTEIRTPPDAAVTAMIMLASSLATISAPRDTPEVEVVDLGRSPKSCVMSRTLTNGRGNEIALCV
jgi:hypothetical protein